MVGKRRVLEAQPMRVGRGGRKTLVKKGDTGGVRLINNPKEKNNDRALFPTPDEADMGGRE
jgi:hypothetical protein